MSQRKVATYDGLGNYTHCATLWENSTLTRIVLPLPSLWHHQKHFGGRSSTSKMQQDADSWQAALYHININFWPEKLIKKLQEFGYVFQEI